ncbi:MAG: radical SAM protein [Bacteroidales bacterium]|nr:radical SAM protein [Bacteroidales bacterium]
MEEALLIIRKITWRKTLNAIKRGISIALSRMLGRYVNMGMPWSYSIEPCNICNLKCRECASGTGALKRRRGSISLQDFYLAVNSIEDYAINLFLYFQGEPTLHPHFAEMVRYAGSRHIHTATSTNGHYLTPEMCQGIVESGLGKIIVSLDGYNQESYQAYRAGGCYTSVLQGIRNLASAKRELKSRYPVIEVQTLVTRYNENHLDEIRRTAMECGANLHYLKTMQIEHLEDIRQINTTIDKYSRYTSDGRLKHRVGFCTRIINSAVITIDMDVLPCCYDKDSQLILGNLRSSSLKQIIKSKEAENIINRIENQPDKRPDICRNCGG